MPNMHKFDNHDIDVDLVGAMTMQADGTLIIRFTTASASQGCTMDIRAPLGTEVQKKIQALKGGITVHENLPHESKPPPKIKPPQFGPIGPFGRR